jgi:hypothetical protein
VKTAKLTVLAPTVSNLSLVPPTVIGGDASTGTVTLTGIAASPLTVTLTCTSPDASVPNSLTVPAGQLSATFSVGTKPVSAKTIATIKATGGGVSKLAILTIKP